MNSSIHLHDHLLAEGGHLHQIGRSTEARACLQRLLAAPDVSPHARAEAHAILGEIEFGAVNYRQARRHFAAVIALRPYDTETCLRYANAIDADPDADPRKGWVATRRATRIDSFDSRCWTALGQSSLRIGDRKWALKAFRRAARLRPERLETLAEVVEGFVVLGRPSEARAVLIAARFRRPNDADMIALWNQFRFDRLRRRQAASQGAAEATILRFPGRNAKPNSAAEPVVLRADRRSSAVPHLLRLFGLRAN